MGLGYKVFTSSPLTASDVNGYLMKQTVMSLASLGGAASITPPEVGMVIFTRDTQLFRYWDGSAWRAWGNQFPDGANTNPGIRFEGELTTGFYRSATQQVSLSLQGTERHRFTATQYRAPDGDVSNPSFTFLSDADTGFFKLGTNTIGVASAGVQAGYFTSAGFVSNNALYVYSATDNKIMLRDDDASGYTSYIRWEKNTGVIHSRMGPAGGDFYLYNAIGDIFLQTLGATNLTLAAGGNVVAGNFFSIPNHESGSYSELGNCNINPTGGRIRRHTSTIRNKYAIHDRTIEESMAVLRLRPVTFKAKSTDRPSFRWTGLIAEEVAATGVEDYANYEVVEDEHVDVPAGVNMPPIVADLINIVRHLWEVVHGVDIDLVDIDPRRLTHLTLEDCPGTQSGTRSES